MLEWEGPEVEIRKDPAPTQTRAQPNWRCHPEQAPSLPFGEPQPPDLPNGSDRAFLPSSLRTKETAPDKT